MPGHDQLAPDSCAAYANDVAVFQTGDVEAATISIKGSPRRCRAINLTVSRHPNLGAGSGIVNDRGRASVDDSERARINTKAGYGDAISSGTDGQSQRKIEIALRVTSDPALLASE